MKKTNKRLAKAIVLGLVLSSAFAGSAWAAGGIEVIDTSAESSANEFIATNEDNWAASGLYANASQNNASIIIGANDSIKIEANSTGSTSSNRNAYGIQAQAATGRYPVAGVTSIINVTSSSGDVTITANSQNGYAHAIDVGNGNVTVNAKNGVININATGSKENTTSAIIAAGAVNKATVTLNSQNNTINAKGNGNGNGINAYNDTTVVELNARSQNDKLGNNVIDATNIGVLTWDSNAKFGSAKIYSKIASAN